MQVRSLGQKDPPGGGNGNPLQSSCLENPKDRTDWKASAQRVAQSRSRLKRLNTHTHAHKG